MMPCTDIHTHVIPQELIEAAIARPRRFGLKVEKSSVSTVGECFSFSHEEGFSYEVTPTFYDPQTRTAEMQRRSIDQEVISVSPTLYYYEADIDVASEVSRLINDALARWISSSPKRFKAFGTVPMQDPEAAVLELQHVMSRPGFVGIQIGGAIEGKPIADPCFDEFWAVAEDLKAITLVHPHFRGPKPGLEKHFLTNLIGNPLETTIAISLLILEGVFDRQANLRMVASHGIGYLPYGIGRIDHGHHVRQEVGSSILANPSKYLEKNIYSDCITHDPKALVYLKDKLGSSRVLLGSDYPFDMGLPEPVGFIDRNPELTRLEKDAILSENWRQLLVNTKKS